MMNFVNTTVMNTSKLNRMYYCVSIQASHSGTCYYSHGRLYCFTALLLYCLEWPAGVATAAGGLR